MSPLGAWSLNSSVRISSVPSGGSDVNSGCIRSVVPFMRIVTRYVCPGTRTRALTGALSQEVGRVVEQTFGVDTFQMTPSLIDPTSSPRV